MFYFNLAIVVILVLIFLYYYTREPYYGYLYDPETDNSEPKFVGEWFNKYYFMNERDRANKLVGLYR